MADNKTTVFINLALIFSFLLLVSMVHSRTIGGPVYDQRDNLADEPKKFKSPIGAKLFIGKRVGAMEMLNRTTEFLESIKLLNCSVVFSGQMVTIADTPHNQKLFSMIMQEEMTKEA